MLEQIWNLQSWEGTVCRLKVAMDHFKVMNVSQAAADLQHNIQNVQHRDPICTAWPVIGNILREVAIAKFHVDVTPNRTFHPSMTINPYDIFVYTGTT
jgi:hypothetical protein